MGSALGTGKARISKALENLKKKKEAGDRETQRLEASRRALKDEISNLSQELEELKRVSDLDSKQIIDLLHERDILNKSLVKADDRSKQQVELVLRHKGQA